MDKESWFIFGMMIGILLGLVVMVLTIAAAVK